MKMRRVWKQLGLAALVSVVAAGTGCGTPSASRSAAVVALNGGVTLWIDPSRDSAVVLSADGFVIPRADGMWRVDLDSIIRLSRLGSDSGRSVPDSARAPEAADTADQNDDTASRSNESENGLRERIVLFLSPELVSLKSTYGEYWEPYELFRIVDSGVTVGQRSQRLEAVPESPAIADSLLIHDRDACADSTNEIGDQNFLEGATQTFGIMRSAHAWQYAWRFGYGSGAC